MSTKPLDKRYTPEQLDQTIQAYFDECKSEKTIPGMEGLANAIKCTRRALENYMNGDGNRKDSPIYETLQLAEQHIRAQLEKGLLNSKACTGPLFALKNTRGGHWRDTQTVEQNLSITDLRGAFDQIQTDVITPTLVHATDKVGDTGT